MQKGATRRETNFAECRFYGVRLYRLPPAPCEVSARTRLDVDLGKIAEGFDVERDGPARLHPKYRKKRPR